MCRTMIGKKCSDLPSTASPADRMKMRPTTLSFEIVTEADECSQDIDTTKPTSSDTVNAKLTKASTAPRGGVFPSASAAASPENMLGTGRRTSTMGGGAARGGFHHNCISRSSSTESILDDISNRALMLFSQLDCQNVGYIGIDELAACCPDLSTEELTNLFNQLDRDNDGKISVRDFKEGFRAISRTLWAKGNERRKSRLLSTDGLSSYGGSNDQLMNTAGSQSNLLTGAFTRQYPRKASDPCSIDFNDMEVPEDMKEYLKNLSDGLSSLHCQEKVCELYHMLTTECPELVVYYESIVLDITDQVRQEQSDLEKLEESFMTERRQHDQRFKMLEYESERQLRCAEERILADLRQKLQAEHKHALHMKDQDILSYKGKIRRLEMQLEHMRNQQDSENEDEKVGFLKEQLNQSVEECRQLTNAITELRTALAIAKSEHLKMKQEYDDACRLLRREKATVASYMKENEQLHNDTCMLREINLRLNATNEDLMQALQNRSALLATAISERDAAVNAAGNSKSRYRSASMVDMLDCKSDTAFRSLVITEEAKQATQIPMNLTFLTQPNSMHDDHYLHPLPHQSPRPDQQFARIRILHPGDEISLSSTSYSCQDLQQVQQQESQATHPPTNEAVHNEKRPNEKPPAVLVGNRTGRSALSAENINLETFDGDSQPDDSGMSTLRDITEIESDSSVAMSPGVNARGSRNALHEAGLPPRQNSYNSILDASTTVGVIQSSHSHDTLVNAQSSVASEKSWVNNKKQGDQLHTANQTGNQKNSRQNESNSGIIAKPLNLNTNGSNKRQRQFKVVLAGDAAVGKSSFIVRVCDNKFAANTTATLGVDFRNKYVDVEDEVVCLQLWDTAGQERFRSMAKSHFRRGDGVLLLYDCTYERSFLSVRDWIEDIKANARSGIPIVIVANKVDLREDQRDLGVRVVDYEEGKSLAEEYQALFMETSNKDGYNTLNVIIEMARLLRLQEDIDISYCQTRINLKKDEAPVKGSTLSSSCCNF